MKRLELKGQRFGRLTVEAIGSKSKPGRVYWLCRCLCGNTKEVQPSHLVHGGTRSCGCLQREAIRRPKPNCRKVRPLCKCTCGRHVLRMDQRFIRGHNSRKRPYEALFNSLVWHAKRKGIAVSISYQDFLAFTRESHCFYCDVPLCWTPFNLGRSKAGCGYNLDRKDNSLGYAIGNLVVCCSRCNKAKSDHFSHEEWVIMTSALKDLHKSQGGLK